ncbi:beta-N-acetylhexosaminidase [Streptomyces triticagri]|uniref:beta-N-acetylhexosaminidase n=1 Tax=Streptomyces triticagri TaxID=2293568 RepID=A0A372LVL7_9ACTN|nr:family 20 glycosylhydrolase [Streptomyces triticagri]RFU82716.1 beta-N-acetylhexosaminidase [Streptomyces triticagri]
MNAVIPAPATTVDSGGAPLTAGNWHIRSDPGLRAEADTLRELLAPHLGPRLLPPGSTDEGHHLWLTSSPTPTTGPRTPVGVPPSGHDRPVDESYEMRVDADGITCRAHTATGAFRAGVTAAQLLITGPDLITRQQLTDAPYFAWRGLMLDPARTFLDGTELRRLIDLAALYKLNAVHLHLTDNEGWRLEIPGFPGLTPAPDTADARRTYYTLTEYRDLQEYAARRHITLVPEIDLPGHCATLRAAVPGLPDAPAPEGLAGRYPFVPPLDLTDARTREVVAAVLAEVCAATRGPFVHIGGDEAFGATEQSLAASVRELRSLVGKFGKRPLAWQEASRAGVEPGDVLQHWVDVAMMDLPDTADGLADRPELLAAGHTVERIRALKRFFAPSDHDVARILAGGGRVLLSPQSHLYLDRPYAAEVTPADCPPERTGLGFPNYRPGSTRWAASWTPAGHGIPEERIAGVEATLFAERLRGFDDVTTLLLPRLAGVAEAAWSGAAPDWESHRERLGRHAALWRARGLAYFPDSEIRWH